MILEMNGNLILNLDKSLTIMINHIQLLKDTGASIIS